VRKQLLYLTNNQLTAYAWVKGDLCAIREFANDATGWQAFSSYLASQQGIPAYLLVDLIEEAFQRDTIPHVLGKTRATLIKRRLGQIYRDTPYRQGSIQGRDKGGRKDDLVLFSALTNPALPKPWVDAILEQRVPLAGIFSLALLSSVLFKYFGLGSAPLLLATHQSSGLRQSYFQDGTLRFSRLTPLSDLSPDAIAETATLEIGKTRQFLASTRQLPAGALIHIVILANDNLLPALQTACRDTATVLHRLISLQEAAHLLGLKHLTNIALCDPLFLSLLGSKAPANHYRLSDQTRFYKLWQTRIALYWLSAATVATGIVWTGMSAVDVLDTQQKNRQMELAIRSAETRYRSTISTMPSSVAKPQNMKATVDIEAMIAQNAPEPIALFSIVSRALNRRPEIRIDQMQWQVRETDPAAANAGEATPPAPTGEAVPSVALIGIPKNPFQVITIEGEVAPFKNDFRTALESVRQFTAELVKNKQVKVEVTRWPLDIRPAVKLDGNAGNEDPAIKAGFALKLVWNP
jgi:hypothetical protein